MVGWWVVSILGGNWILGVFGCPLNWEWFECDGIREILIVYSAIDVPFWAIIITSLF